MVVLFILVSSLYYFFWQCLLGSYICFIMKNILWGVMIFISYTMGGGATIYLLIRAFGGEGFVSIAKHGVIFLFIVLLIPAVAFVVAIKKASRYAVEFETNKIKTLFKLLLPLFIWLYSSGILKKTLEDLIG